MSTIEPGGSTRWRERLLRAVVAFSPESPVLGGARTLLAAAQLSILLLTPSSYLFVPVLGQPPAPHCDDPVRRMTAYCLAPDSWTHQFTSWLVIVGLLCVASGYRPRLTGPLHWWLTLSVSLGIALPDGGEAVAQNVTFLLMLIGLDDRRKWHWQRSATEAGSTVGALRGLSFAAYGALRVQVAYIYLNSAIAKIAVPEWGDGTALFYIFRGENFGSAAPWSQPVLWISGTAIGALALAWGTIVCETGISLMTLGRPRVQRVAWMLAVGLHLGIAAFLGIWSFALVMIASVTAATFQALLWTGRLRIRRDPATASPSEAAAPDLSARWR